MSYSRPIQQLITAFSLLPTVGERTAERYVFHLLKSGKKEVAELTLALKELIENIKSCEICWDFSESSPCNICLDKKRDHSIICVVAEPQDIQVLEKTNSYNGLYHVLRGTIKTDEDNWGDLKIKELIKRIKEVSARGGSASGGKEIILALNPNLEGETTAMYLEKRIKEEIQKFTLLNAPKGQFAKGKLFNRVKVTRLARGLPMGSDLQYADEITLSSALKNRTQK